MEREMERKGGTGVRGVAQLDPPLHPPGPVNLTHFTEKETETHRYLIIDQVNSGGVLCFPQGWVFRCRPNVRWTLAYYYNSRRVLEDSKPGAGETERPI